MAAVSHLGVLRSRAGAGAFRLTRHAPSPDLAPWVERHWIVRWDLEGREPYPQETLPHPCVNVVIDTGKSGVFGVGTRKFEVLLEGRGQVVGVKFKPGAFHPFLRRPVSELTDRMLPLDAVFGGGGADLERAVLEDEDDARQIALIEAYLRPHLPAPDDQVTAVLRVIEIALGDREITTVEQLTARSRVPERTLQRLFRKYVGVSPKWVIQRFRLHEAVARAEEGAAIDWASLAHDLGYFDQAHFIHDFKAQVGRSPTEHVASCATAPRAGRPASEA